MYCFSKLSDIEIAYSKGIGIYNRGFVFGDGYFETIKADRSGIFLWTYHKKRIRRAAEITGIIPDLSMEEIPVIIQGLMEKISGNFFKIKIHVHREGAGAYASSSVTGSVSIRVASVSNDFNVEVIGGTVGVYPLPVKLRNSLSGIKTISALPYVVAANHAMNKGFSDVVLLNDMERVAEFSSSNIFLAKDGELHTPSDTEGCVLGVVRSFILENAERMGLKICCRPVIQQDLYDADFLVSTNAAGIKICSIANSIHPKSQSFAFDLHEKLKPYYFESRYIF